VITPSAKEFLKDITIEYADIAETSGVKNQEKTSPKKSHLFYQFKIKIDITISRILILQKKGHNIGKMELVEALNTILMIVKAISIGTLLSYRLELIQKIEKFLEEKRSYSASLYPEGIFIPTYKDEDCVIALFELHAYLQELEHFIAKEMKEILKFEDYINYISIATSLKDYCWILMVQSKESSVE